jgi:hypothetical protein
METIQSRLDKPAALLSIFPANAKRQAFAFGGGLEDMASGLAVVWEVADKQITYNGDQVKWRGSCFSDADAGIPKAPAPTGEIDKNHL